jgi:subtilisin-like proprotein convertase family protein
MQRNYLLLSLLFVVCLFAKSNELLAQTPGSGNLDRIPILSLPAQDNDALLAAELAVRVPGRAPHFAVSIPVDVSAQSGGHWTDYPSGISVWRLRVQSPNAISINFGFTEYWMPREGELFIYPGNQKSPKVYGPFTPADNEVHNELWTQIIEGDDLIIEVQVPSTEKDNLRLRMTSVNHDFLGFGAGESISGSCNLDVVCAAADGWGIVDQYRDIIRSVAVIGFNGGTFCTGFLVNNTRQDCTPYFMTANHCGINAGNSPSLVAYWNYENSICRQPNSGASGGGGNGQLNVFNSGAIWRASNPASDMTIVELDDPLNPNANAFFAGWSRESTAPGDTVIAVHHPSTDEKRISFTFQNTYRVNGISTAPAANGTHITIPDWDIGTTEGGSSGSPVFDKNRRVRGQLHGGGAACGNNSFDSYGFFHTSWEGGGSPSSRLRDWLNPDGLNPMFIDGREWLACQVSVSTEAADQTICDGTALTYNFLVGGGFANPVNLSIDDLPAGFTANYSQNPVPPNTNVSITIAYGAGSTGTTNFTLTGSDGVNSAQTELSATIEADVPSAPFAISPANGSTDAPSIVAFTWSDLNAASYDYELGTNITLTNLLAAGNTPQPQYVYFEPLEAGIEFFWRVRAVNECGAGDWSEVYRFTTGSLICGAVIESTNVGVSIPDDGPQVFSNLTVTTTGAIAFMTVDLEISHTYAGDLDISLIGPDGTSVELVNRIGFPAVDFGCSGENLELTFSDAANNSSDNLENTCNDNPAASGEYQPLGPLATFNGLDRSGNWRLAVRDNAGQDIGTIDGWSLTFCGIDGGSSNYTVSLLSDPISACANQSGSAELQIGEAFGDDYTVEATINGQDQIITTQAGDGTVTVGFANFLTVPNGAYDIAVTVISNDGISQTVLVPLTVLAVPSIAVPANPANGITVDPGNPIGFTWNGAARADDYSLQISLEENFASLIFNETTTNTFFTLTDIGAIEGLVYWRVVANNECGNSTGAPFTLNIDPNGVHHFGADQLLAVFPNPAKGQVFIEMTGNWVGTLEVRLVSISGQLIRTQQLPAGGRQALNVSELPAGTYLIDLRSGGQREIERLVILR